LISRRDHLEADQRCLVLCLGAGLSLASSAHHRRLCCGRRCQLDEAAQRRCRFRPGKRPLDSLHGDARSAFRSDPLAETVLKIPKDMLRLITHSRRRFPEPAAGAGVLPGQRRVCCKPRASFRLSSFRCFWSRTGLCSWFCSGAILSLPH